MIIECHPRDPVTTFFWRETLNRKRYIKANDMQLQCTLQYRISGWQNPEMHIKINKKKQRKTLYYYPHPPPLPPTVSRQPKKSNQKNNKKTRGAARKRPFICQHNPSILSGTKIQPNYKNAIFSVEKKNNKHHHQRICLSSTSYLPIHPTLLFPSVLYPYPRKRQYFTATPEKQKQTDI